MRILYFSRSYTPHDHRFLAAMSDEGYEVYFLQLESQAKVLEERKLPAGVKLLFWEVAGKKVTFFSLPKYIREFRAILEEIKPDIVHAFGIFTHLTPSIFKAAHKAGVPVLLSCNDYKHICPNRKNCPRRY